MDMEALQIKELKLPSEHEHEIGQKRVSSDSKHLDIRHNKSISLYNG
jgi:hypothetical protein